MFANWYAELNLFCLATFTPVSVQCNTIAYKKIIINFPRVCSLSMFRVSRTVNLPAPMNHVKYLRAGPAEMPFQNWYTAKQVSSMKSTTKLSRFLIDHRRSTVILRRWICIDCRYRPYSPVGGSLSTVDIDGDRSTGSINPWIGIDI